MVEEDCEHGQVRRSSSPERIAMRPGCDVPRREDLRLCDCRCTCKLHAVPVMPHLPAVRAVVLSMIHGRCTHRART